ncbi:MAG: hypothetical protein COS94_10000, partial [Candidatus Hydrogenedentes bacterium CG07_land_8_20_14_0_80_42_17]
GTTETKSAAATTVRRSTVSTLIFDQPNYRSADTVIITTTDLDRNRKPRSKDTFILTVSSNVTLDSETIILNETTETSGIFDGSIPLTRTGSMTQGDGTLLVQPGDSVIAFYNDSYDSTDSTYLDVAIVSDSTYSTMTLNRDTYRASNLLIITIRDLDKNIRALIQDTIEVSVTTSRTNDAETVVLTETALASGIFTNSGLRLSDTIGINVNDGILFIGADDTFIVRYEDPIYQVDSSSATGTFVKTPSASSVTADKVSYLPGEFVTVTAVDIERNLDPLIKDTVIVTITSPRNDTEILTCLETTETSGIFVSTTSPGFEIISGGLPGDGRIQALISDVIYARYTDPDDTSDQSFDTAQLLIASIYQIKVTAVPYTDTTELIVMPLDESGDSIPTLEGLVPIQIASWSGGTGNFQTTSETVVQNKAHFVYSKREDVTLEIVFQVSDDTYPALVIIPAPGVNAVITVSDIPRDGSIGTMMIPYGLFSDSALYSVANRTQIDESGTISALINFAGAELQRIPNVRLLSSVSNSGLRPEHRFLIKVNGVEQHLLPGDITLIFTYPDSDSDGVVDGTNIEELNLRVYRLDENLGRFELEPDVTIDNVNNRISVRVNHLTIFTLAGGASVTNLDRLNVYPNPFEPNSNLGHLYVTFDNVPSGAKLRIFTAGGRLVDEAVVPSGANTLRWNGTNRSGFKVASGVYVYVIEHNNQRKVGKVVVVR